jgi:D-glycero-alpha-D-manno-heptose 1-phosphate guanylyltransferase
LSLPSQCAFLVGGLGTRLGALTAGLPKPLVPVAGRPFLEWLLDKAVASGATELLLLAGHRSEALAPYLERGVWQGVKITASFEPQPFGTAGALVHAAPLLEDDFLLVNGDTWFDFDWSALDLAPGCDLTLALRSVSPADRYETATLDGARVTALRPRDPTLAHGLINGGVYRMRKAALAGLATPSSLETDLLPRLCAEGRLGGQLFDGAFIDIGIPESLRQAQGMSFAPL